MPEVATHFYPKTHALALSATQTVYTCEQVEIRSPLPLAFSHFWDFPTRGKITGQAVYTCEPVGIRSPPTILIETCGGKLICFAGARMGKADGLHLKIGSNSIPSTPSRKVHLGKHKVMPNA